MKRFSGATQSLGTELHSPSLIDSFSIPNPKDCLEVKTTSYLPHPTPASGKTLSEAGWIYASL